MIKNFAFGEFELVAKTATQKHMIVYVRKTGGFEYTKDGDLYTFNGVGYEVTKTTKSNLARIDKELKSSALIQVRLRGDNVKNEVTKWRLNHAADLAQNDTK